MCASLIAKLQSSGVATNVVKTVVANMEELEPVCGTIAQVTGDNLGLHTLLGYAKSFNVNYFCHFCLVDKQTSQ